MLCHAMNLKDQLKKLSPWNKRWFVLCDDGKLYYYKAPEDAKAAKVPLDMNLVESVSAVNGSPDIAEQSRAEQSRAEQSRA